MSLVRNTSGQYVFAVLISATDGSPITSGASLAIAKDGNAASAGGGTLTHLTEGLWRYALTQAETDAAALGIVFYATGAVPQGLCVITQEHSRTLVGTNLDAAVSTRLASASYTAPPSASANADAVRIELATELGRIDAAVSSRLASASYTAPPTVGAVANAVWDETLAGHAGAGSTGEFLAAAGALGNPLEQAVPGDYAPGTAGYALGFIDNIAAKTNLLGAEGVTVSSPVASAGVVQLIAGDDYAAADGRALEWVNAAGSWPDLMGSAIAFRATDGTHEIAVTGSIVTASGPNQHVRVALTATDTSIPPGYYSYDVQATLASGRVVTLARGEGLLRVLASYAG